MAYESFHDFLRTLEKAGELTRVALPEGGKNATPTTASTPEPRPSAFGLPAETGGIEDAGSVSGERFFKRLTRELEGSAVA